MRIERPLIATTEVSHFIPLFNHRTKTCVRFEATKGVFQSLIHFTAFDGEMNIFIHGSHGHKNQFCVVIVQCDSPIITKNDCQTIEECFNFIDGADEPFRWSGSWWKPTRKWAETLLGEINDQPQPVIRNG